MARIATLIALSLLPVWAFSQETRYRYQLIDPVVVGPRNSAQVPARL